MSNNTQVVQFETLRSIANGSISGSYAAIGTPFLYPCRMLCIINNTDGDMFISDDGTNNKMFVPKNSFRIYDFNTNRVLKDQYFSQQVGTQLYVKQSSAPTTGSVYVEVIYGAN